ncbi:efflux RND transporter periplasmic adaptor subunit [Shewanella sedimentimangrovi]|uniref:Efflux RND transporter periplasmic adaptor subunit n=1 Tax=Shewanella sedimentimangrovi TaxID=2814293 RepID=A0ABX7R035_9GAMM|nr:efflux RND transporter periplasmic adaptor subunit [Shewanella sedimentimangrovi]QSX36580.1 efflux RND transporter periplasmic adaptor subunit [Shewanella sedimentimangrovi]
MRNIRLAALLLLLCGCNGAQQMSPEQVRVQTFTIPKTENEMIRVFNGVSRAQDLTQLSFRIPGRIASIPVSKGQVVKQGQVLALLDKKDFEIILSDRRARLEVTAKQAERAKQLVDQQLMAQAEYDQLQAQFLVAQAQARQAELNLQYTELKAPFDGTVSDVFPKSFENVQPGTPIVSMHKSERIEVAVQVPDVLIAVSRPVDQSHPKSELKVSFEAFPEVWFKGSLLEITSEKDPASQTYIATVAVELDEGYKVLEGMPAKVEVDLAKVTYSFSRQFKVPVAAVVMPDGSDIDRQDAGVWLFDPASNQVHFQPVTLGVITGDRIEIRAGLSEGQMIVTQGLSRLVEGQQVERIPG